MASMPKLSMVADPEQMALDIHTYVGSSDCFHDSHSSFKMCEGIAEYLCDGKGTVRTATDFLESLKTNPLVLEALKKQMAFIWDQGWISGKAGQDIDVNPYGD